MTTLLCASLLIHSGVHFLLLLVFPFGYMSINNSLNVFSCVCMCNPLSVYVFVSFQCVVSVEVKCLFHPVNQGNDAGNSLLCDVSVLKSLMESNDIIKAGHGHVGEVPFSL